MGYQEEIHTLAEEFESCRKLFLALGDANRQYLILEMIRIEDCNGVRVGTITEKTHLSRPAVSHHLRVLREVGILKIRKEGTKNFYYFDPDTKIMDRLLDLIEHIKEMMDRMPDRSGER